MERRRVVIIGAGTVGTSYAYALMQTPLADEISLIDLDEERVRGEIMDLSHGVPFTPPVELHVGSYEDCRNADLIVITAGAKQKSGESRLDLLQKNARIIQSICEKIAEQTDSAVIVLATNPVDLMTYVAIQSLDWPDTQILGSGTVLDTSRFRYMLSEHCDVDARNVHAYILGEHGDSELAAWSISTLGGVKIQDYCSICQRCKMPQKELDNIELQVRDSAYHIIDYKGATNYAIGLALVRISEAIVRDEKSILTVSSLLDGQYGISDICLSVPRVVGRTGVTTVIETSLSEKEHKALQASADTLKKMREEIQL